MKELMNIQAELKAPKGQMNKFGGYRYRSCEDILEAVKPLLLKNECVLTITDDVHEVGNRIYISAKASLTNKDGKTFHVMGHAREAETRKGMDDSQITGSASSYARKYALNGLFAIDDTKDADATNDHGQNTDLVDRAVKAINAATDQEGLDKVLKHCKAKDILDDKKIQAAIKNKSL